MRTDGRHDVARTAPGEVKDRRAGLLQASKQIVGSDSAIMAGEDGG